MKVEPVLYLSVVLPMNDSECGKMSKMFSTLMYVMQTCSVSTANTYHVLLLVILMLYFFIAAIYMGQVTSAIWAAVKKYKLTGNSW